MRGPWSASAVYTGGAVVSHGGQNWKAGWWTQGDTPGTTGEWGVWRSQGACGGGTNPGNPGNPGNPTGFVVSEAQFNQMFPTGTRSTRTRVSSTRCPPTRASRRRAAPRSPSARPRRSSPTSTTRPAASCTSGDQHRELPALLRHLEAVRLPGGPVRLLRQGPIQLSWNYNYKAAGDALGIDLLNNPYLVEQSSAVAWKTGLWFWNTQSGAGSMSGHQAIVSGAGFGESIRSINGTMECNGGNPAQVQSRIAAFQRFAQILGTTTGNNLSC